MLPPYLPPHNIILFELDFSVKFPLLRLLQFLSDLKSTIPVCMNDLETIGYFKFLYSYWFESKAKPIA